MQEIAVFMPGALSLKLCQCPSPSQACFSQLSCSMEILPKTIRLPVIQVGHIVL